mmetsp:Transcript_711/g.1485  ORF Transcript_711/g.1485 Transcript_711/m.1485 type:complete len:510 (+) Transcript_711:53-1582(+)
MMSLNKHIAAAHGAWPIHDTRTPSRAAVVAETHLSHHTAVTAAIQGCNRIQRDSSWCSSSLVIGAGCVVLFRHPLARRASRRSSSLRAYQQHLDSGSDVQSEKWDTPQSRRKSLSALLAGASSPLLLPAEGSLAIDKGAPDLKGRTACVTGASRGIGKGIAIALGEAGAKVFVTGRREDAIKATASLVNEAGGVGIPVLCDHGDDAQVQKAFAQIADQTGGKLDILVNNAWQDPGSRSPKIDAQLSEGAKFYELPLSVWDDVHRVGLRSHYVASYYAAPLLLRAVAPGKRPLVAMISAPAAVTYYFAVAYGVGKAGVDRLARDLNVEFAPQGVDCISIWPGVVYTETVQRLYETGDVERLNRVTGGLDPEDVCESPLLTGRVIAKFAAEPQSRAPPYISPEGLTGRVCVVAEGAKDFGLRDGGPPNTVAGSLYGPDRRPAPSIRSAGYLGPVLLKANLPSSLQWLAEKNGPFATTFRDVKIPFEFMAKDPRKEDPRKQDLSDFTQIVLS